ncbi:hypothetical protein AAMO2058_000236400 [Amorphochlora amoebiformis]
MQSRSRCKYGLYSSVCLPRYPPAWVLLAILGYAVLFAYVTYVSTVSLNSTRRNFPGFPANIEGLNDDQKEIKEIRTVKNEIPKIIHQTWKDHNTPGQHGFRINTWKSKNPKYHYILHTDEDIKHRVESKHPELLEAFRKMKSIHKADLLRYMVLYDEGGVYSDIDTQCIRPIDEWLAHTGDFFNTGLAVGVEVVTGDDERKDWRKYFDRPIQICQWTIMGAKGHPVFKKVLKKIEVFFKDRSIEQINNITVCEATGPAIWSDAVIEYIFETYNVTLGEPPLDKDQLKNRYSHVGETLIFPLRTLATGSAGYRIDVQKHSKLDTYVKHNFAGSWVENKPQKPWERDSQGRPWSSRWGGGLGSSRYFGNRIQPGCFDTESGGKACQYEESPKDEGVENLFDSSQNTKWLLYHDWSGNTTVNGAEMRYTSPSAFRMSNYTITSAKDAPERDPVCWKIWVSNDNSTWDLVSEIVDANFTARSEVVTYTTTPLDHNITYIRMAIFRIRNPQKATSVQFSRLQFQNHPPPPPVPPVCQGYPFSWSKSRVCTGKNTFSEKESPVMAIDMQKNTKWLSYYKAPISPSPFPRFRGSFKSYFQRSRDDNTIPTKSPTLMPTRSPTAAQRFIEKPPYLIVERQPDPVSLLPRGQKAVDLNSGVDGNKRGIVKGYGYTIVSANDYPSRDPASWNLYALTYEKSNVSLLRPPPSSSLPAWRLIDSRQNITFQTRGDEKTFKIGEGILEGLDISLDPDWWKGVGWVKLEILEVRDGDDTKCGRGKGCVQLADFSVFRESLQSKVTTFGGYKDGYIKTLVQGSDKGREGARGGGVGGGGIPRMLHQSWKTVKIPEKMRKYVASWHKYHSDWEYRFWTDHDCRELFRLLMSDFLPIYDSYKLPVQRADASRYLIIQTYGGVYVDLDFEALREIDEGLLGNYTLVIGQEPKAHTHVLFSLERLICNAWLASVQGHPLWDIVFQELRQRSNITTISATGPRALDAAFGMYQRSSATAANASTSKMIGESNSFPVKIVDSEVLYPFFDEANRDIRRTCAQREKSKPNPTIHSNNTTNMSTSTTAVLSSSLQDNTRLTTREERLNETCRRLEQLNFKNPPLTNKSYAVHHWVHTWFPGRYSFSYSSRFSAPSFNAYEAMTQIREQVRKGDKVSQS